MVLFASQRCLTRQRRQVFEGRCPRLSYPARRACIRAKVSHNANAMVERQCLPQHVIPQRTL